jgi:dTDP-4-amino-4,6-dideoxygalactose transaminase
MRIPFIRPSVSEEDISRMNDSIRSGWMAPGKYCRELEEKLADYLGMKYVKLTNSCTSALHASLIMSGVKEGDEVITTTLSWVATANVIGYLGAKPVFVDVDISGRINTELVKKKITSKTKAIIPVHIYGQLCEIEELGVPVIEDSAHCLMPGVGKGDFACFSFHVAKNLTCGNGGAIASNHPIDERILYHGVEKIDDKRRMTGWGFKGEMTDFQAAMLLGQLDRIEETQEKRRKVVERYRNAFKDSKIFSPIMAEKSAHHLYVILADKRDEMRKRLAEKGIETSIHYEPIHLEPYYASKKKLPMAEYIGRHVISLPTYPDLTEEEQDYIIKEILHESSTGTT